MKAKELLKLLIKDGWYVVSQKGSHIKLKHNTKSGSIIFPNHGSKEIAKVTEKSIRKKAGLK